MKTKTDYFVLGVGIFAMLASVIAICFLPEQVPIHWNMYGEADGYGSKYIYLLFGSLGLLSYYLMNMIKRIDPYEEKINHRFRAYATMRNLISLMLSGICFISLLAVMVKDMNIGMLIPVFIGLFFIVIGNFMPRIPHNYFMGVKTPWAITDETNWKKTQRAGGYGLVLCGLLFVVSGLLQYKILMALSFSMLFPLVIGLYVYSWYLFKSGQK